MSDRSSDPCNDTKYIVTTSLAKEKKPTQDELDAAVGHLQSCAGCRAQFELHERASFTSDAALGRKDLGGKSEAALGPGSKASKRAPAPYPMPKPRDTDVLEAS